MKIAAFDDYEAEHPVLLKLVTHSDEVDLVVVNEHGDQVPAGDLLAIRPSGLYRYPGINPTIGLPLDERQRLKLFPAPDPEIIGLLKPLAEYVDARNKDLPDEPDDSLVSYVARGKCLTVGLLRRIVQAAGLVLLLCATASAASPESYYLWAMQQNQQALKAAYARHDAVKARVGDRTVRGTRSTESAKVRHRFGGGVGAGGFGGDGGYAGYNSMSNSGFGFHYGYGFGQPGNNSETTETGASSSYEKVWHDDAWYGGPVEVLNPFCPPE